MREEITKAYSKDLAEAYDARHFGGKSGQLIFQKEREALADLLSSPDGTVLDVPCGTGVYAGALQERGNSVVAFDASAAMLEVAGRRVPGLPRVLGDISRLPFRQDSFDATVTLRLFSHFPNEDVAQMLCELRRVTRAGGQVVFDTFRWSPRHWPLLRRVLDSGVIFVARPAVVEELIRCSGLRKTATRHLHLFSPIWQRKVPFWILKILILLEGLLPQQWLLRTLWACRKDS